MPYREPQPPPQPSPEVDAAVLRPQWWRPLLVVSFLVLPPWLLLTWLTNMAVHGCGPTHEETFGEKMATTVVFAFWIATLLWFRARHRRRERAALAALRSDETAAEPIAPPGPEHVRVHVERTVEPQLEDSALADDAAEQERARRVR